MTVNRESLILLFTLFCPHLTLHSQWKWPFVFCDVLINYASFLLKNPSHGLSILLHPSHFLCIIYILTIGNAEYFIGETAEVWRAQLTCSVEHGQWAETTPQCRLWILPCASLLRLYPCWPLISPQSRLPQFLLFLFNFLCYSQGFN